MKAIIINYGSGAVKKGSQEQSESNIQKFIEDLGIKVQYRFLKEDKDGRHDYKIWDENHKHIISMPALPINKIRYMEGEGQKIWNFPRLYVDGSSWIWCYALGVCFNDED